MFENFPKFYSTDGLVDLPMNKPWYRWSVPDHNNFLKFVLVRTLYWAWSYILFGRWKIKYCFEIIIVYEKYQSTLKSISTIVSCLTFGDVFCCHRRISKLFLKLLYTLRSRLTSILFQKQVLYRKRMSLTSISFNKCIAWFILSWI